MHHRKIQLMTYILRGLILKRTTIILAGLVGVMPTMTAQACELIIEGVTKYGSVASARMLHLGSTDLNTYASDMKPMQAVKQIPERMNNAKPTSIKKLSGEPELSLPIFKKAEDENGGGAENSYGFRPWYAAVFSTLLTGSIMADEQDRRDKVTYQLPSEKDLYGLLFYTGLGWCFKNSSGLCEQLAGRKLTEAELFLEIKLAIDNYRNRSYHYLKCLENSDCGSQIFAFATDKETIELLKAVIYEELDAIKDEEKVKGIISSQLKGYRSDYKITEDEWQRYLNLHDKGD